MVRNVKGFTMVELMIVIAIIGILAVTLIPAFSGMQNRAKDTGTASAINSSAIALESWKNDANTNFGYNSVAVADQNALNAHTAIFTSLKSGAACGPQSSAFSAAAPAPAIPVPAAGCTGTSPHSFGYALASTSTTTLSDTYIIWAKLYIPAKGTLVNQPMITPVAANANLKTMVNMNGNQTVLSTYAVHGGNRQ